MVASPPRLVGLQLQDRDIALLVGLFESRVMTLAHMSVLFFAEKREYAKKRLRQLKEEGLIAERKRRMNEPAVLFLTRQGFQILKERGLMSGYPSLGADAFEGRARVSDSTLDHELQIMDVKAAVHAALSKSERFSMLEFCTWPLLCSFRARDVGQDGKEVVVRPDGLLRIKERNAGGTTRCHDCFLELDRSSETQETLVSRAGCYLDYYRTGGFALRNGGHPTDFRDFPFRLLIVLKSAARRNNTAERLLRLSPPILALAWLTTFKEVAANPLGPIWIQPKGYRSATIGTSYDSDRGASRELQRQDPSREVFVESRIEKLRLLEN